MIRLKSYFSESVESALSQARQDFGPEALLVETKRTGPEASHLGAYQVTFQTPYSRGSAQTPETQKPVQPNTPSEVLTELVALRRSLDTLVHRSFRAGPPIPGSAPFERRYAHARLSLEREGLDPELAANVLQQALASLPQDPGEPDLLQAALQKVLRQRLRTRPLDAGTTPLLFVGPPGGGKTTLLAKVAATAAIDQRRKTLIIGLDSQRIGARAQIRELAVILGAHFRPLEDTSELGVALQQAARFESIFIDTPGLSPRDAALTSELESALKSIDTPLEVHLVIPATVQRSQFGALAQRFTPFHPQFLCLTHLDEPHTSGVPWNAQDHWELPISYLSNGPGIPEDLLVATPELCTSRLLAGGVE